MSYLIFKCLLESNGIRPETVLLLFVDILLVDEVVVVVNGASQVLKMREINIG